jgi:hypothetical protein
MKRQRKGAALRLGAWFVGAAVVLAAGPAGARAQGFGRAGRAVAVGPRGGAAVSYRGGAAVGPWGGARAGGVRTGTYVGPGGTTVQAGRVGGAAVGPLGGVRAGGASGVRVTTPYGQTYAAGRAGGVGVGPYGGVRAGQIGSAYRGPNWGAGTLHGVAAVGHATRYWGPTYLGRRAAYVRSSFVTPVFNPVWFRAHPAAWVAPRWRVPNVWAAPGWALLAGYCGITAPPIVYDYGGTTVIDNDYVFVNGAEVATAEQYAAQAAGFADRGRQATPDPNAEWQPLGVFALVQGDDDQAQHVFQLAVDRAGVVRGNYYDAVVDNSVPVYGSVDPATQRVAWSAGEKKTVVFETGLNNLTQDQTTVLVHYGNDRTVQMGLVRLNEPAPGK